MVVYVRKGCIWKYIRHEVRGGEFGIVQGKKCGVWGRDICSVPSRRGLGCWGRGRASFLLLALLCLCAARICDSSVSLLKELSFLSVFTFWNAARAWKFSVYCVLWDGLLRNQFRVQVIYNFKFSRRIPLPHQGPWSGTIIGQNLSKVTSGHTLFQYLKALCFSGGISSRSAIHLTINQMNRSIAAAIWFLSLYLERAATHNCWQSHTLTPFCA